MGNFIAGLLQQSFRAFYGEFDMDQTAENKRSLCFFPRFFKKGKRIMIDIVTTISEFVAALSIGGIVVTLFLIAIGKIGD